MMHHIPCDDCGKLCRDIELNTKRGSNKLICDECAKKGTDRNAR
jgi:hypothetical protein